MLDIQSATEELEKDREAIAKYTRMLDDDKLELSRADRQRYTNMIGWYEEHAQMMERIIAAYAPLRRRALHRIWWRFQAWLYGSH